MRCLPAKTILADHKHHSTSPLLAITRGHKQYISSTRDQVEGHLPGVESVGVHGRDGGPQDVELLDHLGHDPLPELLSVGEEVEQPVLEPLDVESAALVLVRLVRLVLVRVVPDRAADPDSKSGKEPDHVARLYSFLNTI